MEKYTFALMNRKNLLLAAGCGLLILASCQSSPKNEIVGKWQMEGIESPFMDSIMKAQEHSIDTMSTVDSNMARMTGTNNLDSIKMMFKKQLSAQKDAMNDMYKQITMNFLKEGKIVQEGGGRTDTANYVVTSDKKLKIIPKNPETGKYGDTLTWAIEKLTTSELRFKAGEGDRVQYINLKPASDKKAEEKK